MPCAAGRDDLREMWPGRGHSFYYIPLAISFSDSELSPGVNLSSTPPLPLASLHPKVLVGERA